MGNRKMEDLIILDNLIQSFAFSLPQGIPIKPFYDDTNDRELNYIARKLEGLKSYNNTADYIESQFKLSGLYSLLSSY